MAGEDPRYIRWVATLRCCAPADVSGPCPNMSGPPHHPKEGTGKGQRAHDHRAIPLCTGCHESRHRLTFGRFKGWVRDQIRDWERRLSEATRAAFLGRPYEFDPELAPDIEDIF